jgi:DNA-binding NarL/FixJ family response regulator
VPGAASLLWRRAPCNCPTATVIDVLVVDDHPAVRAGLVALLRAEPGIVPVATAVGTRDALGEAERCTPDVALVDYDLRDGNGLELCYELKALPLAPRVLVYSAFARDGLGLAARVAGADGLLDKGVGADELFETIRSLAAGRLAAPTTTPEQMVVGSCRLDSDDLPILGMLLDGEAPAEIAAVLDLSAGELRGRVRGILARLAAPARRPRWKAGEPDN